MIRKVVLFFFSPLFAMIIMVVPDAWTLCMHKSIEMQEVANAIFSIHVSSEQTDNVTLEERAWMGDGRALERIGKRYAKGSPTSGWRETRRLWNRMFCSFLLPIICFAVVFYPYGLMLVYLDLRRIKKGFPPRHWKPFYAWFHGLEKHFTVLLAVWMSVAYYVFRYWMLSS